MTADLAIELQKIEEIRRENGIAQYHVERAAMLCNGYYSLLITGAKRPRMGTLNALRLALRRLIVTPEADTSPQSAFCNMAIRAAIALLCEARGLNAEKIQNSIASKRATQSPEWLEAARVRRDAWALVSNAFGISGSDLARAAGVSKAAISLALRAVEDARDDKEFDREMERLERALTGGGW
ncbi:hypothetical protein GJU93_06005 [Brucella sp. 10RB9212]|uniref:hypothetical protein n=1 Tax=unclassified Brucella TaxID=2632610 RepID=UPI000972C343|nr:MULTISPECIES: hypothetical protein [unclassified Brucella]APY13183.1 hypothetical protein BKD02_01680 [Brucella sp. 09RB8910]MRN46144.1 hypothetical protein [Brucella sp. 10RB9212]